MTNEEAKYVMLEYKPIAGFARYCKALDVAISALENQIPSKPIPHTLYQCPNCEENISKTYKHCPNCGQALDWSDSE